MFVKNLDSNQNTFKSNFKSDKQNIEPKQRSQTIATIGIAFFGSLSIGLLAISLPFVWPAFRRHVLPYIPATDSQVNNVLQLVKKSKPSTLIDLGSGDGRLVIECAKIGIKSYGVELNPWLVLYSKIRSRVLGVNRLTHFECKDLWKINASNYDNIVIFGVEEMMRFLETKIQSDCDQRSKQVTVIACRFPFANWTPVHTIGTGIDTVWLYRYPNSSFGRKF